MNAPVKTTSIALKTAVSDEVIVNRDGSTGVQATSDLAMQLASSWPLQISGNAGKLFTTFAILAATPYGDFTPWVFADPDIDKNGLYRWNGASWQWSLPLPYSFLVASNVGAGTPAAIKATTLSPVSTAAMILLPIAADFSGVSATVSFNGGAALAIKSSVGEDVTRLTAGSILYGVVSGDTFRLANDETVASLIFEARDAAEAARDEAVPAAQTATTKASEALASAVVAAGYAAAAGISRVFATKAEADAGLSSVAANAFVKVMVDETQGDVETVYQKVSGAYVLKAKAGQKDVRPENFGAIGDDATSDRAAFLAAKSWIAAHGGDLILSGATAYYVGSADQLSMDGVAIYAEDGAKIRGNWNFKAAYKLLTPVDITLDDTDYVYLPRTLSTKYRRHVEEKDIFFGAGDVDRTEDITINCLNMMQRQITWPAGVWTNVSTGSIDTDYINFLLSSGQLYAATTQLRAGEQLTTIFAYGEYDRAAIIRTANGFYTFLCSGMSGTGALYFNDDASGTQTLITTLDWSGRGDQKGYFPGYAEWCIDIITPKKFRFLLNGLAIGGSFNVGAGDFFAGEAGFGVINGTGLGGIKWPVLRRNAPVANHGFLHIVTAGDSRVSAKWDDWPTHMGDMLEGSLGASVLKIENLAVDGWTTATTLATLQNHGLGGGITHLICDAYNNDVQNGVPLADTRQNILNIIDLAQSKNIVVIWLLCPGWYPQADTGKGVITYNDALAPQYRAMARWLSGLRGCRVIDMTHLGKPIMAYEAQSAPGDARFTGAYKTGLVDNIHFGSFYSRKVAEAAARIVLGILPMRTRTLDEMNVPANLMKNGWSAGALPLRVAVDASGNIRLSGRINAGTKTANTRVLTLPSALQPFAARLYKVMADDNSSVRIEANGDQLRLIDAVGSGANALVLDGVSWAAR
ncbi:SGNH/GDSL hydrolase family protein [Agrobacterium tumefaciens]|uniref:SGNH/GDSL hydrolase family protein n=1 Tax=Agrobacterium tumefaciens TaxID=358 RepID=UPI0015736AF4|nr:SGNH/GDSL hydrolase family protein [Agrobacterium tumefaciens]WCK69935.1 SGNH/GDSL hydrolase family protein [Agrobacterium tumefaciens]